MAIHNKAYQLKIFGTLAKFLFLGEMSKMHENKDGYKKWTCLWQGTPDSAKFDVNLKEQFLNFQSIKTPPRQ